MRSPGDWFWLAKILLGVLSAGHGFLQISLILLGFFNGSGVCQWCVLRLEQHAGTNVQTGSDHLGIDSGLQRSSCAFSRLGMDFFRFLWFCLVFQWFWCISMVWFFWCFSMVLVYFDGFELIYISWLATLLWTSRWIQRWFLHINCVLIISAIGWWAILLQNRYRSCVIWYVLIACVLFVYQMVSHPIAKSAVDSALLNICWLRWICIDVKMLAIVFHNSR